MKRISILLLVIVTALVSCKKVPEVNKEYVDVERDLITVGTTTATIQCDYKYIATLKKAYLYYGEGEDATDMTSAEMRVVQNTLYVDLEGLRENAIYSYYYEFYNGFNSMRTEAKTFKTENSPGGGGGNGHEGALSGLFSVAPDRWVRFSKGNLQYQASTNTWRFAENQWDYVGSTDNVFFGEPSGTVPGSSNHLSSSDYSGWIDLFGWGTSGYHDPNDPYNIYYQPWSNVIADSINANYNTWGFGPSTNMPSPHLTGSSANYDWGVYNPIINGGNQANIWRTLSCQEWDYVAERRSTTSNMRYAKAQVNGINGVILFPDNWSAALISVNSANDPEAHYDSNVILPEQWDFFEQNGAAFLPAAGCGPALGEFNENGRYWQTEGTSSFSVNDFQIQNTSLSAYNSNPRYCRFSVRLVQDDNP